MKKLLTIFTLTLLAPAAHAACPSGWEEVSLENFQVSTTTSCPSGLESYYHVDNYCSAHVY